MSARLIGDWVARHRTSLAVAILGAVGASLAAMFFPRPASAPVVIQQPAPRVIVSPAAPPTPPPPSLIVVHLSGEVIAPGVYQLPIGARVDDAVRAAGGMTPDGDVNRVNLAARLADGQHVVVPRKSDPTTSAAVVAASSPAAALRININTATVAELDGLPGVGPVTAQRIVAYRQQNGPFTSVEQLRDAKLVNQATFDKIRDLVST